MIQKQPAGMGKTPQYSIDFVLFTGEEEGTGPVGSLVIDLSKVNE